MSTLSFDIIARDLASKAFGEAGKSAEGFHGKLEMIGGLATGVVGAGLTKLGEHLEETRKVLEQSIGNAGQSFEEYSGQIDKAAEHQAKFGHSSADTNSALAVLVRSTGNTKTALADMDLVTQLAAVHHSSLADAANTVAKMHAGSTKALKEFGINAKDAGAASKELAAAHKEVISADTAQADAWTRLNDLQTIQHAKKHLTIADSIALRKATDAEADASARSDAAHKRLADATAAGGKAMDFASEKAMVLAKIQGTAEAQADTFGGKIKALKTHFEDMAATLGAKVGPALTIAGPLLAGVGGIIESGIVPAAAKAIMSFGSMAAGALASFASMIAEGAVWAASMAVSGAIALAPFLPIIAVVAAVGVAAFELYKHWDQVWGFIKRIVGDGAKFVTDHIVLIATIALGPIGFAIAELATHWDTVWGGVKATIETVWKFIEPIFKALKRAVDDIAGPLGKVAGAAGGLLHAGGSVIRHIPGFADGGYVPGRVGQPQLAVVHGGELVLNQQQQRAVAAGSGVMIGEFHVHTKDDPRRIAVAANQGLRDAAFLMGV